MMESPRKEWLVDESFSCGTAEGRDRARRRGLRLRAGTPRLYQGRAVRARGGAGLPRRGARAAPGVPARGRRGDGRADLLRTPGETAGRGPRGRPGGDEPAGRSDR